MNTSLSQLCVSRWCSIYVGLLILFWLYSPSAAYAQTFRTPGVCSFLLYSSHTEVWFTSALVSSSTSWKLLEPQLRPSPTERDTTRLPLLWLMSSCVMIEKQLSKWLAGLCKAQMLLSMTSAHSSTPGCWICSCCVQLYTATATALLSINTLTPSQYVAAYNQSMKLDSLPPWWQSQNEDTDVMSVRSDGSFV